MKGDFQVRFRENLGVKLPWVTRLWGILVYTIDGQLWTYPIFTRKSQPMQIE
jgi:hypothetical protein